VANVALERPAEEKVRTNILPANISNWIWRGHVDINRCHQPIHPVLFICLGLLGFIPTPSNANRNVLWNCRPANILLKRRVSSASFHIGLLTCTRAIQVFGFDYMVVLYLYFPEESKIQENRIYSVLRHPTYAGAILIAQGGTFFTFTFLSFATYVLLLVGFCLHVHFVEEKELIKRFGDSYRNYRQKVPAFFINLNNLSVFLRFLFEKGTDNL
jgi:protein-S-isoprenylcysteine O-methyltransferase Ste14